MPEIKPTKTQVITMFVNKMMADKGIQGMTPEEEAALKEQLGMKLEEQIEQAMIRGLSDEKLDELEGLLERDATDEELEKFFDASGVDFQAVTEQTMMAFRKAYLAENGERA